MHKRRLWNPVRFCATIIWAVVPLIARAGEPGKYPLWDGQESVADYAQRVNLPPTKTLDLGDGVKLETVLIPAGKFSMGMPERETPVVGQTMVGIGGGILLVLMMGVLIRAWRKRQRPQFSLAFLLAMTVVASLGLWGGVRWRGALQDVDDAPDEHPAHEVTLTQPFYMGKFSVTQEQYQQVIGANPSYFKGKDNPVEMVSWDDAQAFCKKLSQILSRDIPSRDREEAVGPLADARGSEWTVRLPTEAEWEYACRAGSRTKYYSGDTEEDLKRVAWYDGNANDTTHPVGRKEPNRFGLYDMHGNVWQWCQDWYGDYAAGAAIDPQGPADGWGRVLRGGAWHNLARRCRSAYRSRYYPVIRHNHLGFRVVLGAQESQR